MTGWRISTPLAKHYNGIEYGLFFYWPATSGLGELHLGGSNTEHLRPEVYQFYSDVLLLVHKKKATVSIAVTRCLARAKNEA